MSPTPWRPIMGRGRRLIRLTSFEARLVIKSSLFSSRRSLLCSSLSFGPRGRAHLGWFRLAGAKIPAAM